MPSRSRTSSPRATHPRTSRRSSGPRTSRLSWSRLRRVALAALVTASVAVPISGAARPADVPAPAPTVHGQLRAATPAALAERYAGTRVDLVAAARTAEEHGDTQRAEALRTLAAPARQLLSFDGRNGGRAVEVMGDLARADRIAVLVPGAGTSVDNYGRLRSDAGALRRTLGDRSAVVAWLGYRTPEAVSLSVATARRAARAVPDLRALVDELTRVKPAARTSLVCHSYGTVVCAGAASRVRIADIVLYGSPGTGYDSAAALRTEATVWAGRSSGDWTVDIPHRRLRLPFVTFGFGTDPVSPEFGARTFRAGHGQHSEYLKPGSLPLRNIARIVAGEATDTGGDADTGAGTGSGTAERFGGNRHA
ncbi:alpha/beta hydrolase [Streptomyces sp. NPDC059578]|uniref:alpha/beta hydrolase n=1 Tax=unclassified Streptomyces TaxID=2593676 RepID=UPI00365D3FD6